ncbi:hypothetical protein [Jannaschia formosa]|uniref:hypothetical protein n=1 Tax=Jannaschia formosa TaxID=2259592 RepID=UPI001074D067|nr:hypothetical protein [Jannaschia formosa]TFL16451.1 hypothetical protein DR046_20230 [Jannaschia formosa]
MANIFDMVDVWNDAGTTFTAIKMDVTDTASASASLLLDLQVGGDSRFKISKVGDVTLNSGRRFISHEDGSEIILLGSNNSRTIQLLRAASQFVDGLVVEKRASTMGFKWGEVSLGAVSNIDLELMRDAADILALRRSTNAQTFTVYNTYTDASNYERLKVGWAANALELKPEAAGTGTTRVLHISGLPTSNPGAGILWNDAGTVKVGT